MIDKVVFTQILILIMIEYLAIRYLIKSQMERSVGEIMFDHNHEEIHLTLKYPKNRNSSITVKQITYRREELKLKRNLNRFRITVFWV